MPKKKGLSFMMELLKKGNKAFTLIEMVITLAIITVFLIIPMSNFNGFDRNLHKTIFFNEFTSAWRYSLAQTKIRNKGIEFRFDATNQLINYRQFRNYNWHTLKMPQGIELKTTKNVIIKPDGTIRPFSIIFFDSDSQKNINYRIQMEWGEIIVT